MIKSESQIKRLLVQDPKQIMDEIKTLREALGKAKDRFDTLKWNADNDRQTEFCVEAIAEIEKLGDLG